MLNKLQNSLVFTYTMDISLNDSINAFDDYPRTPSPHYGISPRTHNDISYPHVFNRDANMI